MGERDTNLETAATAQTTASPALDAVLEFYRTQWKDIQFIWSQRWSATRIMLVAAGLVATLSELTINVVVVGFCIILGIVMWFGARVQKTLDLRVQEKWKLIQRAEKELNIQSLLVDAIDADYAKSKKRQTSTGNFGDVLQTGRRFFDSAASMMILRRHSWEGATECQKYRKTIGLGRNHWRSCAA